MIYPFSRAYDQHTRSKPLEYITNRYPCPGDTGFSKPNIRVNTDKCVQFLHKNSIILFTNNFNADFLGGFLCPPVSC
jgi:hypothetical protein